jgi:ABC-type sugar transport system ATPase subunit
MIPDSSGTPSVAGAVPGPGAPAIEWRNVSLELGPFAVRDVTLRVDPGDWLGIIGPTGAGKTLLLEIAAGFRAPTTGCVLREGHDVTSLPPERRRIAYVPQDGLLFPHLDVRHNLAFALARADRKRDERLLEVAASLGIAHLLRRRVRNISGGEAQRVAIGRALLADADLILLDECTSALDEETKVAVGDDLLRRRAGNGWCVVQVSHDRDEIERLADRVVTMDRGRLVNRGARTTLTVRRSER